MTGAAGPRPGPQPLRRYAIDGPPDRPLRFGLLADEPGALPRWAVRVLRLLIESGLAAPALIVVPAGTRHSGRPRRDIVRHPLYYLARASVWRTAETASEPVVDLLQGVPILRAEVVPTRGRWQVITSPDVAAIRSAGLDFMLRFGFGLLEGDVLDAARHGVWSFHHGDERRYRGRPAAFWELFDGSPDIGVVLQRLTGRLDAGQVLRRGTLAADRTSYPRTLDRVYRAGIDLPLQVCRDLVAGREVATAPSSTSAQIRGLPGSVAVARVLASTAIAALGRALYGAFVLKRWSIGRLHGGAARIVSGDVTGARWLDVGGRTRMLADPMIVPGSGGRILLCEAMDYGAGPGVIARIDAERGVRAPDPHVRPLIAVPGVHLSYPTVIATIDGLLCLPEAAASGGLMAFHLNADATAVSDVQWAAGLAAVDPTVFQVDGRWWLACTEDGPTALSHLWLFHAPSPLGPWTAHALNPVRIDVRSARPAGLPFEHEGALYRPAQDCRGGYGRAVTLLRIHTLTPTEFDEEIVAEIRPESSGPYPDGLHTISIDGDAIWIDGYREIVHPLAGWYRLRARRQRGRPAALADIGGWPA